MSAIVVPLVVAACTLAGIIIRKWRTKAALKIQQGMVEPVQPSPLREALGGEDSDRHLDRPPAVSDDGFLQVELAQIPDSFTSHGGFVVGRDGSRFSELGQ